MDELENKDSEIITIESEEFIESPVPGLPFGDLVVIVNEKAFEDMMDHARSDLHSEVGGLLLGGLFFSNNSIFVEIEQVLSADQTSSDFASIKFNYKTWLDFDTKKRQSFPDKKVVGWYHSHIGIGVFFSSMDKDVHRVVFPEPWLVGVVVDPIRDELAVFRSQEGNVQQWQYYINKERTHNSRTSFSQQVAKKISLLSSFIHGRSNLVNLSKSLEQLRKSFYQNSSFERSYYFSELLEAIKTLEEIASLDHKSRRFLQKLFENLSQDMILSSSKLDLISAKLTKSSCIALSIDNLFILNEPLKISYIASDWPNIPKVFSLLLPIGLITGDKSNLYLLGDEGEIYFSELSTSAERENLFISSIGIISPDWWNTYGRGGISEFYVVKENLFALSGNCLWKASLKKNITPKKIFDCTELGKVSDFAVDQSGYCYLLISEKNLVIVLDRLGNRKQRIEGDGIREFLHPKSVVLYQEQIIVFDEGNARLVFFNKDGEYQRQFHFTGTLLFQEVSKIYGGNLFLYIQTNEHLYRVTL